MPVDRTIQRRGGAAHAAIGTGDDRTFMRTGRLFARPKPRTSSKRGLQGDAGRSVLEAAVLRAGARLIPDRLAWPAPFLTSGAARFAIAYNVLSLVPHLEGADESA